MYVGARRTSRRYAERGRVLSLRLYLSSPRQGLELISSRVGTFLLPGEVRLVGVADRSFKYLMS